MKEYEPVEVEKTKSRTPRQRVKKIDPLEPLKMEIAAELGLLEQVRTQGWHTLTAKDAGRIGGLMTQRRKLKG